MSPRILFVHNQKAGFVRTDRVLLSERYVVDEWYQAGRAVNLPRLAQAVRACDLVVGWFASWHTFFPVLLARRLDRPSLLIVGGYDTANMPEIGYGSQRGGLRRWVANWTMRSATRLVTNSQFTKAETIRHVGIDPEKVSVVYHGLPPSHEIADGARQNMALTVGNVDRPNMQRKGLEPFVRAAAWMPETEFLVVGRWIDDAIERLKSIATANVRFSGRVDDRELATTFANARVYVQASRHEGFGLAVAEAMLYGCVPVVTRSGALPEVVGDAGVYVDSAEPGAIAEAVGRALALGDDWRKRCRQRIESEFTMVRRKQGLYAAIEQLLAQAPGRHTTGPAPAAPARET